MLFAKQKALYVPDFLFGFVRLTHYELHDESDKSVGGQCIKRKDIHNRWLLCPTAYFLLNVLFKSVFVCLFYQWAFRIFGKTCFSIRHLWSRYLHAKPLKWVFCSFQERFIHFEGLNMPRFLLCDLSKFVVESRLKKSWDVGTSKVFAPNITMDENVWSF